MGHHQAITQEHEKVQTNTYTWHFIFYLILQTVLQSFKRTVFKTSLGFLN